MLVHFSTALFVHDPQTSALLRFFNCEIKQLKTRIAFLPALAQILNIPDKNFCF